MLAVDENYSWQPIGTAPEGERIMVAGWQPKRGNTRGYWWYHEDVAWGGAGTEHPEAELWAPLVIPPLPTPKDGQP